MDKEMQNNIENDSIAESIFDKMVEEYGITDLLIGCLIGLGSGAISMAIYFSKCKRKNNLGGMKNVKR